MSYGLSLGVIFGAAAFSEWLSTQARASPQSSVHASADELARMTSSSDDDAPRRGKRLRPRPSLTTVLREGVLHAASIALNMAIMLLSMSFNVGIFTAIVLGVAFARTTMGLQVVEASGGATRPSGVELCH